MTSSTKDKELYSGKATGLTFEAFDEKVITWCRKKYGDSYAVALWKNELANITDLDLSNDEDGLAFDLQCAKVYDILCRTSVRNADHVYAKDVFWTKKWQIEYRQSCREEVFCFLEETCSGEAARQLRKQGVKNMATMRDFMFRRFGAGQPELIQERVAKYLLGLPDANGEAFPPRCDMEAKLDELEKERENLIEMCPKDKRDGYQDGSEETLIRLILRYLPIDYDAAVKSVRDLSRLRKYGEEGDITKITNLEDNSRLNYSTDWLPDYQELRAELVNAYHLMKRRREEKGRGEKRKTGHPVMPILNGFDQPGPDAGTCYRCGEKGHRATDSACKGKEGDCHKDAPEWFKRKFGKGGGKGKGKGHGKGKGKANGGRKWKGDGEKLPCANHNKGNGYCKWGDNCRFSHAGPKGGKRKHTSLAVKGTAKKQKKEMMSMLVKVLDEATEPEKEPKEKQASAKDRLRQIMRGSGTLVGVVTAENERHYVPSRPQPSYRAVLMIGEAEGDAGDDMPAKRKNYTPKRKKAVGSDKPLKEVKPIQSLFTILKNLFDKNENDETETVEKIKKSDGQGAQSFKIEFGDGYDHRDSPESRLKARETAFESPSPSVLGRPGAQTGGRWLSEEKGQAQRKESVKFRDVGDPQNEIKQTKMQIQHSPPPRFLPPKAFSLTNGTVTISGSTTNPKQQQDPDEKMENVWTEKGKRFKEDDQVMMITVSKETGQCDVLYLNAASDEEDIRLANRATFPVGTSVEEILDRRPPRRVNHTVFRDYKPGERRERELVPFTFDDENEMGSSPKRTSSSPPEDMERPTSPRKRDRPLRKSAKETDTEQGGFLTAMGSEEGEKSSSSSIKRSSSSSNKSSIKKKKYKNKCDDWGAEQAPSERPTWGRFMWDEDEKRVAKEWLDLTRRADKKQQEANVARGNSPTRKGKEESSAFNDLNERYIDPFDGPPSKPNSSTLFIRGGYEGGHEYKTKEVKVMKGNNKGKSVGCLTQEESANPEKRTVLVEVTWTPTDRESGREDITKSIEFNPHEAVVGGKRKWTVQCGEGGVPELKEEALVAPRQSNQRKEKRKDWGDEDAVVLVTSASLHDLELVGIDTCSAVSVSTEKGDFLYVDDSPEAKDSVTLNGVGGANTSIGGRGPMVVRAVDDAGNDLVVFDPAGVFLDVDEDKNNQQRFRIFGQQKLKEAGLNLQQDKRGNGIDFLTYRGGKLDIPLETNHGIVTLRTKRLNLTKEQLEGLNQHIDGINEAERSTPQAFVKLGTLPSLVMNEGKLTREEKARLEHWRMAHRKIKGEKTNESCPICAEGKRRTSTFKRNEDYREMVTKNLEPYWRMYVDGYGGQRSMGEESYQGAVGGFVFVCPSSGTIKVKLYATSKQFPAILYQVLQEVETEGYACREIYCDTFKVNFSAAAEEVATMFKVKLVPISAGTPQELAYAENAVKTIAAMSRSLMAGAPHLKGFCWGLADLHAANVHHVMPQQSRNNMSPYEYKLKREPDRDALFLHVFGCPVQYEPYGGALHKRAPKTEWGYYVGVQWPMVLVLRESDWKVISVSRKKVLCHEERYAKSNLPMTVNSITDFIKLKADLESLRNESEALEVITNYKEAFNIPDHVLSVKSLDDYQRNPELNEATPTDPPRRLIEAFSPHPAVQGEYLADHASLELLMEELKDVKEKIKRIDGKEGQAEAMLKALKKLEDEVQNTAARKGSLKKGFKKDASNVNSDNIVKNSRSKKISWDLVGVDKPPPEPAERTMRKRKHGARNSNDEAYDLKSFAKGDRVKIRTKMFGALYAQGREEYSYGNVVSVKGNMVRVLYDEDNVEWRSHATHLTKVRTAMMTSTMESLDERNLREDEMIENLLNATDKWEAAIAMQPEAAFPNDWETNHHWAKWKKPAFGKQGWFKADSRPQVILPVLEMNSELTASASDEPGNFPKDFWQALVNKEWRDWVTAVKTEMESWDLFDAAEEVAFDDMQNGATIIPLGELFTIKRSGKHKFRQIAMGNLMKEGRDYGETFSSTVSGDGIRWFFALAAVCGYEVRGWDATTGYLQVEQRVPIYAYLPSHHGFSNLSFEALAELRMTLLEIIKEEGMEGIKRLARKLKKERRDRPKRVLKLKKSIYGIPDAGQAFSMFIQGLHTKGCGLTQSEMDPCIFYKINTDKDTKKVTGYLIVMTWVDDCRYFGTPELVRLYEKTISENCKCTMEGETKEFVSIQVKHDRRNGTIELTQEDYWVKAIERFREYLPAGGPKPRLVPLSPADERLLVEPTEKEMEEAKALPYASLLGVCQYPSAYTRLEMRYAMSVLSRWRTKWGKVHFAILVKSLEYGYDTRKMGLKYGGALSKEKTNVLEGFADSSLSLPRSQGCRCVTMNNAAISLTSKRHTTTDDSTAAAELTECYLCACDVEGYRNLMEEVGLAQLNPTTIWQDNQAAIQIAMNRGALAKKTRAMDLKVLTLRNKVEDMKCVPIYLKTSEMIADIGTKALDPTLFCYLRDKLCGYWKGGKE